MAIVRINLPGDLKARAQARAAEEGFASLDEYVADLIRADAESEDYGAPEHLTFRSEEELEAMLLERLDGPRPPIEFNAEFKEQFMDQVRRRRQAEGKQP